MSIDRLKDALPDYAKDLKLNLGTVLTTPGMTPAQIWGTALSCAIASRSAVLLREIAAEAALHLDAAGLSAAKTAAALMAMNNVYYRFTHLIEHQSPDYKTMPARLRMNGLAQHGADPVDFELWCLAVSAVNACGRCLEAHEAVLLKKGASRELVQNVVRIGAVIQAVGVTLDAAAVLGDLPG
jgi:alkyl hydroperoxide reductase subunit D